MLTAVLMVAATLVGATPVSLDTVLSVLRAELIPGAEPADVYDRAIIWSGRFPRAVLAAMVGASLALAGGVMQGLFRNPLASPGIVGTSAGASFGALIAISMGLTARSMFYLPALAVTGALLSLLFVLWIADRDGRTPVTTLLLAGVAVSAFIGAANGWIIAQSWAEWEVARRIAFWTMGGLTDRSWIHVALMVPTTIAGGAVAWRYMTELDVMQEGDESAMALGVNVERTRLHVLFGAALLTGGAVAVSGVVGFVGLVIPHLVRLVTGPRHRRLLPACAVTGAWFLILADIVARAAVPPTELHLGVVTATAGAPFFVYLLKKHTGGRAL